VQNCGHEFISAKDFDIVDEGNHGVVVEVMQRNVLEDFLGNVWGSDDFNLAVARFRVPRPHTPCALAADGIAGVTGGAEVADFGQEAILDGIVANDTMRFMSTVFIGAFSPIPRFCIPPFCCKAGAG
jgi:hypothetical protein